MGKNAQEHSTRNGAIRGYLSRMRELTKSVARRNEKIHHGQSDDEAWSSSAKSSAKP
jgi:hypothetical protein